MKKVFIKYEDEGKMVEGMFEMVEENGHFVKIKSGRNILTIPFHKIQKIKERIE